MQHLCCAHKHVGHLLFTMSRRGTSKSQCLHRAWGRLMAATALAVVLLLGTVVPLLACDIGVSLSSSSGVAGDAVEAVVIVRQTHRSCDVPIDDTRIVLSGLTLTDETPWEQISSTSYRKVLVLTLNTPGEGRVEVLRICSRGGDRSAAAVAISPASTAPQSTPPADAQSAPPQVSAQRPSADVGSFEPEVPQPSAPLEQPSWYEALWQTLTLPYVIVLLTLLLAGIFFLARGYRRARPFVLLVSVAFLGFYVGGCPCPVGSLQNVLIGASGSGGHLIASVQLGAVVLVTLLVGRVFCGWACPLGAVQFFLFRKEQYKRGGHLQIPREYHRILRWSRYGVLVAVIALVIVTGQPVFQDIDPFRTLFNLDFRWGVPLLFLLVVLAVSVVIGFPFCKYVCPLGALLSLLQPLSLFRLRFGASCTSCRLCSTAACDYGAIESGSRGLTIDETECVRCGECLSRCPTGAIRLTWARRDVS